MIELAVGLGVAFITQFGLLWYKIGRLEQNLADLCREVRNGNNKKTGGKE